MFEAERPFTMLYKYDLVVPWQCVDIGREKVRKSDTFLIVFSTNL